MDLTKLSSYSIGGESDRGRIRYSYETNGITQFESAISHYFSDETTILGKDIAETSCSIRYYPTKTFFVTYTS